MRALLDGNRTETIRRVDDPGATVRTAPASWTAISILCLLGLWKSWECLALFSDGASFFVATVGKGWFHTYNERAREYAIVASQIPLVVGLRLGLTDLHQLARLQSAGALALPTACYVLALVRARHDPLLLSAVLAAISLVFLTTSFFIIGEYNTAYAIAVATAVTLAASGRPRLIDGLLVAAMAVVAVRTYEIFLFLGPLLAAMTMWAAYRQPPWPTTRSAASERLALMALPAAAAAVAFLGILPLPLGVGALLAAAALAGGARPAWRGTLAFLLYMLAAGLFFASAVIAIESILRAGGLATTGSAIGESVVLLWRNLQFELAVVAAAIIGLPLLLTPGALLKRRLFLAAGLPLGALALLPLAVAGGLDVPPLGTLHYPARLPCAFVVVAIIGFAWAHKALVAARPAAFALLDVPAVARRCLGFFLLLLLALLPSDALITLEWASFVGTVRDTVRTRNAVVALADAPGAITRFYWCCDDPSFIGPLSLALRSRPGDAIIVDKTAPAEAPLPDLGGYVWRD